MKKETMDKAMDIITQQSALIDDLRAQLKHKNNMLELYEKHTARRMEVLDHNFTH
jgi:hypothetical protein